MIVAHRGSSGTAPENTMRAIREAVEAGADMVEIDVRLTADHHVVVFHDHVLGRTTNGSGHIARMTRDQLVLLDAGSWRGEEFRGERIPLLDEALAWLRGRAAASIELKSAGESPERTAAMVRGVVDAVRRNGMEGATLLASFETGLLVEAAQRAPEIVRAPILLPDDSRLPSEAAAPVGGRSVILELRQCTRARVADARAHGLVLGAYTVNDGEALDRALRLGVGAIATNHPGAITALLAARGSRACAPRAATCTP